MPTPGYSHKVWKDQPDHTTPISAAALEDLEDRVTQFAFDTASALSGSFKGVWNSGTTYSLGDGVSVGTLNYISTVGSNLNHNPVGDNGSHWTPAVPGTVVNASTTDSLGRTRVAVRGDGLDPALRDIVSPRDAPWGAVGNAKRVTDAGITSGSNQVSSTAAAFTSADVGKSCSVAGAGTQGATVNNPIWGVIWKVTAGVAFLATDGTGATPVNASHTVTNAVCHYGTDDTAAILACAAAISTRGYGVVALIGNFLMTGGQAFLSSNVTFSAYNSTIYQSAQSYTSAIFSNISSSAGGLSRVNFLGLKFQGLGQFSGDYTAGSSNRSGPINLYNATNVKIVDCDADSFTTLGFACVQSSNIKMERCTVTNVCAPNQINCLHIGLLGGGFAGYPILTNDATVAHCSVSGTATACVCVQNDGDDNITAPGPQPFRVRIHDNNLQTGDPVTGTGWTCVALEIGGGGNYTNQSLRNVHIHHNECQVTATANPTACVGIQAVQDSGSVNNPDAQQLTSLQVDHNNVTSSGKGISIQGSYTHIDHNNVVITGALAGIEATGNGSNTPIGQQIDHNTVILSSTSTGHGINVLGGDQPDVSFNKVYFPTSTSGTSDGIHMSSCAHPEVNYNRVNYAPNNGIHLLTCSDARANDNRIYNPATASGGTSATATGIYWNACTAFSRSQCQGNDILDDRGPLRMFAGIFQNAGGPRLSVRVNNIFGFTNSAISLSGTISGQGPNTTGQANIIGNFTAISVTGSPFTFTNNLGFPVTVGVVGGTVSLVQRNRGATNQTTGVVAGEFHLEPAELLTVTYTVAPTMYWSPANQA